MPRTRNGRPHLGRELEMLDSRPSVSEILLLTKARMSSVTLTRSSLSEINRTGGRMGAH